jgi:hypothetical protein
MIKLVLRFRLPSTIHAESHVDDLRPWRFVASTPCMNWSLHQVDQDASVLGRVEYEALQAGFAPGMALIA